jgi:hypothetical protein
MNLQKKFIFGKEQNLVTFTGQPSKAFFWPRGDTPVAVEESFFKWL